MLYLPAPPHNYYQKRKRRKLAKILGLVATFVVIVSGVLAKTDILEASIFSGKKVLSDKIVLESQVLQQGESHVTLKVTGALKKKVTFKELGLEYELADHREMQPPEGSLFAKLIVDNDAWGEFAEKLKTEVQTEPKPARLYWSDGWKYRSEQKGRYLSDEKIEKALRQFVSSLERQPRHAALKIQSSLIEPEQNESFATYKKIQEIVAKPVTLRLGAEEIALDLNSKEVYVKREGTQVSINQEALQRRVQELAQRIYREPSLVTIVGKEEARNGIVKAITEGEFKEGLKIDQEEVLEGILAVLPTTEETKEQPFINTVSAALTGEEITEERVVDITLHEIPVRVYSAIEGVEYDLLGVGFSEYSKGNKPNRVHNIKTGINRVNNTLIDPSDVISFNSIIGSFHTDFVKGYGIFGKVAKPVLGGGICQVSTTFYRGLLESGLPIIHRQNHSWDLSYYRSGMVFSEKNPLSGVRDPLAGYGKDATIFPAANLDLKAENPFTSSLYIYSYTRPEDEEVFILFYGKSDGREVVTTPREEYKFKRGAKTIVWDHKITWPNEPEKEEVVQEIVSRYRM